MSGKTRRNTVGYKAALRDMAKRGLGNAAGGQPSEFKTSAADRNMQAGYKVGEFTRRREKKDGR